MRLEAQIRKLARSNYWQTIYHSSKKCSGVYLFDNQTNFSGIQYLFLHWLSVYSMLYEELSSLEWTNLDQKVINDDYRCDCFLYWRGKDIEKELRKSKFEERKTNNKPKMMGLPIFQGKKNKEGKS